MKYIVLSLLVCLNFKSFAQEYIAEVEKIVSERASEPINQSLITVAKEFLGRPYVAGTLEKTPESLVFNLDQLDCFTLVENVLALTLTRQSSEAGFDMYRQYLQLLRYRDGVVDGYASRLHYFIDWAKQAEQNCFLTNLSTSLGVVQSKKIDFMSTHRMLYPALAKSDSVTNEIRKSEKILNESSFYFIAKEDFEQIEPQIKDGDIIAFTSTVKGLDVNHEGFAIRRNGKLYLLHASLEEKKVVISKETLGQYLNRIKKHSGIMVFRIVE